MLQHSVNLQPLFPLQIGRLGMISQSGTVILYANKVPDIHHVCEVSLLYLENAN